MGQNQAKNSGLDRLYAGSGAGTGGIDEQSYSASATGSSGGHAVTSDAEKSAWMWKRRMFKVLAYTIPIFATALLAIWLAFMQFMSSPIGALQEKTRSISDEVADIKKQVDALDDKIDIVQLNNISEQHRLSRPAAQ